MSQLHENILAEKDGRVGRFTINRPDKRNAMSLEMWRRMGEVCEAWADDPEIRVIVVRGNRYRIRDRHVLRYYARTLTHLLNDRGRPHLTH